MDRRGLLVYGRPLRPPADAVTVRVRDGEPAIGQGPFAATTERMAAYELLECVVQRVGRVIVGTSEDADPVRQGAEILQLHFGERAAHRAERGDVDVGADLDVALEDAEIIDAHVATDASADPIERTLPADLDIVADIAEAECLQFVHGKERRVGQSCLSMCSSRPVRHTACPGAVIAKRDAIVVMAHPPQLAQ